MRNPFFTIFLLVLFASQTCFLFAEGIEKPAMLNEQFPPLEADKVTANDVARMALLKSLDIQVTKLDYSARKTDIMKEKARYDTQLTAEATYDWEKEQQPTIILGEKTITSRVSARLSKKTAVGLEVDVFHESQRNSTDSAFAALNPNYEAHAGVEVRQPLLRNAFGIIDRSEIQQVRLDVRGFKEEVIDNIEQIVFETREAYWTYVKELRLLAARKEAYTIAEKFYDIVKKQLDTGLSELPDFYASEANLRDRIQNILDAQLASQVSMNDLKLLLSYEEDVIPSEDLKFREVNVSLAEVMKNIIESRRDYKQKLIEIESKGLNVKVNKMRKLPQLDVFATVQTNAFDENLKPTEGEIFGFNHPRYFIGFDLDYPLENREARAGTEKAKFELKQAKLELERLIQEIILEIENVYKELQVSQQKFKQAIKIEELQREKLKEESKQFKVGRSSSKVMIDYQDDLLDAKTDKIEAFIEYEKAKDKVLRTQNKLLEQLDLVVEI